LVECKTEAMAERVKMDFPFENSIIRGRKLLS
jgi:hypothetical protein